jgi:large subunit ribosomal protein L23
MSNSRLMNILLSPHVSEKGTMIADKNRQFIFRVANFATKPEIKKAVELLFKTQVETVRTANVKGKDKRFKQIMGRQKDWKKAYVSLKKGHDINFTSAE